MMSRTISPFFAHANECGGRAEGIFRNEGVVALKQVLPVAACDSVRDHLMASLDELADLFAQYGISLRAPDAGQQVERLLERDPAAVPPEHRHVLLGHFPLQVRLGEALWTIP